MSEYVECPVCKRGFYFDVESEGVIEGYECPNEDCSAPLNVHADMTYDVWAEEAPEAAGGAGDE